MTTKERLHQLVDTLPEAEAERMLQALSTPADLPVSLRNAPADDEPYTDEERAAVAEAWEDVQAGRVHTLDAVKRELGL